MVPSLSEAETIRRLLHTREYGVYDASGVQVERRAFSSVALALRTLSGHLLDATPAFRQLQQHLLGKLVRGKRLTSAVLVLARLDHGALGANSAGSRSWCYY